MGGVTRAMDSQQPPPNVVVSVVMSVYNCQRYLAEAVESILAQTLRQFEFIIIDDGSTDGSGAMLKEYAERDPRVRLVSRANKGLTKSLNEGIALSRGRYIARMDADDVALPERFAEQVRWLDEHPDYAAVGSDVQQIDGDGNPLPGPEIPLAHELIEKDLLQGKGGALRHPALMVRREVLVAINGYEERYITAQDLDLYLRIGERGKLANLPKVLLRYRIHPESVNFAKRFRQDQDVHDILASAYRRRGLKMPRGLLDRRFRQTIEMFTNKAWQALAAGDTATARKHARSVLRKAPLQWNSWHLLIHTLLGPHKQRVRKRFGLHAA